MTTQQIILTAYITGSILLMVWATILRITFWRIWYVIIGWPLLIPVSGIMAIYYTMVKVSRN